MARTVVTTTAASGTRPDVRHLMLKNRSAPMSEPKPASVTRYSPAWIPIRSAMTDELPWAMLPKGPACTRTGVFSSVCSRLGLMASRMITVMAPAACSCFGGHGLTGGGVPDDDAAHALTEIAQRPCQGEHRHHLGRSGDVEPCLAWNAVLLGPEPAHDVAQGPVVDVEDPFPGDPVRVDAQGVAVVDVVVHHGGKEVVGRRDCVQVAGEVEVEVLEGHDLAVAAACRTALDPEGGPHGRLADGDRRLLARCRPVPGPSPTVVVVLPSPSGVGRDGRDDHVAGARPIGQGFDRVEPDLGDVQAVRARGVRPRCPSVRRSRRSDAVRRAARSRWPGGQTPGWIMPDGAGPRPGDPAQQDVRYATWPRLGSLRCPGA